jgi:catechol 2,3-dioxygenase-like lactoylglutathione lyase family enzyme
MLVRRPAMRTTERPTSGSSTSPTTTARSCAIPTVTVSRPSTTATPAAAATSTIRGSGSATSVRPRRSTGRPRATPVSRGQPGARKGPVPRCVGDVLAAARRPPTEHRHPAFPAPDRTTVEQFHGAALAAGYHDNGRPGDRPHYGRGYYAAFVLDPDGTTVESVHRRAVNRHATRTYHRKRSRPQETRDLTRGYDRSQSRSLRK